MFLEAATALGFMGYFLLVLASDPNIERCELERYGKELEALRERI